MKAPTQKVVTVRWTDAGSSAHQETLSTAAARKLRLHERHTTGFLLAEYPDRIVIAQDWNAENREWENVWSIPRPWVIA